MEANTVGQPQPQVLVFVPYPRPKTAGSDRSATGGIQAQGPSSSGTLTGGWVHHGQQGHVAHAGLKSAAQPVTWNDELDRKLWSCASLYPHNSVKWDVVARKLNISPDQCIIRFLHLYQQQLHRQLLAQHKPRSSASPPSSTSGNTATERTSSAPSSTGVSLASSGSHTSGVPIHGPPSSGRSGGAQQTAILSSSPSTSQQGFSISSSPTSLFPGYLSSSPSSQAPLFAYAAKHGALASPVGSPASSFLGRPKAGEANLAKVSWPSRREFLDCVERHNFEWLSIGRALNQNPYECRQMYLTLTEGGRRPSTEIERYETETTFDDPFRSEYEEAPQLFQPLHEGSSPMFTLDDDSLEPLRRSTLLSKEEIAAAAAAAATGSMSGLSLLDDEERENVSWLPSASIDQSTLASAFMSTFLNRDGADSTAD